MDFRSKLVHVFTIWYRRRLSILAITFILALTFLQLGCAPESPIRAYKSPVADSTSSHGLSNPIAVAMSADGKRAWCSNIGTSVSHCGFISEIGLDGSVLIQNAFPFPGDPGLQAPKGLAVIGNHLWVVTHQRLVEFSISSRHQERSFNLSNTELQEGYCLSPIGMISPDTHEYMLLGFDISDQTLDAVLSFTPDTSNSSTAFHASWDIPPHSGPKGIGGAVFLFPSFDLITAEAGNQCIRMSSMIGGFALTDSFLLQFPKKNWVTVVVTKGEGQVIAAADDGSMWIMDSKGSAKCITDKLVQPGMLCVAPDSSFALVPERGLNRVVKVPLPHE